MKDRHEDCEKGNAILMSRVSRTSSRATNYSKPLEKWMEEGLRGGKDEV